MSMIIGDVNSIGLQIINVGALVGSNWLVYMMMREKKISTLVILSIFLPLTLYITFVYGTLLGLCASLAAIYFQNRYFDTGKIYNIIIYISFGTFFKHRFPFCDYYTTTFFFCKPLHKNIFYSIVIILFIT